MPYGSRPDPFPHPTRKGKGRQRETTHLNGPLSVGVPCDLTVCDDRGEVGPLKTFYEAFLIHLSTADPLHAVSDSLPGTAGRPVEIEPAPA